MDCDLYEVCPCKLRHFDDENFQIYTRDDTLLKGMHFAIVFVFSFGNSSLFTACSVLDDNASSPSYACTYNTIVADHFFDGIDAATMSIDAGKYPDGDLEASLQEHMVWLVEYSLMMVTAFLVRHNLPFIY